MRRVKVDRRRVKRAGSRDPEKDGEVRRMSETAEEGGGKWKQEAKRQVVTGSERPDSVMDQHICRQG